jgi:predicted phage baseplate assembly protein
MTTGLDTCGCTPAADTGAEPQISNPPGLDALSYRIGTHSTFLRRLLAAIPRIGASADIPGDALSHLTTPDPDDPSIALLDAFATVADVLTFYQERIANEGYLRTATERRSLLELARAIGYELGPGVAASAWLRFDVENRVPAPNEPIIERATATVPAGTRVQSIPEGSDPPQTFETSEELVAEADFNELFPRLTQPQAVLTSAQQVILNGPTTTIAVGDIVVIAESLGTGPVSAVAAKRVLKVVPVKEAGQVRLELAEVPAPPPVVATPPAPIGVIKLQKYAFTSASIDEHIVGYRWSGRNLNALLAIQGWSLAPLLKYLAPKPPPGPPLDPAAPGVYAFRRRAAIFGHGAPRWRSLPPGMRTGVWSGTTPEAGGGAYPEPWDEVGGGNATYQPDKRNVREDSQGTDLEVVRLDQQYTDVTRGSWAVLEQGGTVTPYRIGTAEAESVTDYAQSAKVTSLGLRDAVGTGSSLPGSVASFKTKRTTAHVASAPVDLAEVPLPEEVARETTSLELDRLVLGLAEGKPVALHGERFDLRGVAADEVVILTDVTHEAGRTTLYFDGLEFSYVRKTLRLSANVVAATHGETVPHEVLGGGSGAPFQRHALRKPPLTHVPAATPTGAASTLEVRVDGVRWDEAASLYELGPSDERYIVRRTDDGKTDVVFGDGLHGARVPSGLENVTAHYRSGIGLPGLVPAGKLTLLAARPPGIREVTNPLPSSGAEDPEDRDSARRNAPLTVLTLDRVVSLSDYEDFARAFAGIAKARAADLWRGERRLVHLTVAGERGETVDDAGRKRLIEALDGVRDPGREVRIGSYQPLPFVVTGDVLVDARLEVPVVTAAVVATLEAAFSFEAREFAAAVTLSEVLAVMMGVKGVLDATVSALHLVTEAPTRHELLAARPARWNAAGNVVDVAEMLVLNRGAATVVARSVQP